jgi:cytosolic carboxypeptidase protein 2/3
VKNMRARVPYTFHLVNFLKPDAMYNYGQKPLAYSVRAAEETEMGKRNCLL